MMMPWIRQIRAGRRDTHVAQAEMELQLRRNSRAVLEVSEKGLRSCWRRVEASAALGARNDHAANEQQRRQIRELPMGRYSAADTHEGLPAKWNSAAGSGSCRQWPHATTLQTPGLRAWAPSPKVHAIIFPNRRPNSDAAGCHAERLRKGNGTHTMALVLAAAPVAGAIITGLAFPACPG